MRRSIKSQVTLAPMLFALATLPLSAQTVDPGLDSLVGLYRDHTGAIIMLWRPALGQVALGFDDGSVRVLVGSGGSYSYGPSLGITSPVNGTLRRVGSSHDSIAWKHGDGAERRFGRVPLKEEPLAWQNGKARLAGTMIVPPGPGPFPAVVMLHGAGPETRETSRAFAYYFAAHGVASLIYDKRSTGASAGGSIDTPFEDLARDAIGGTRLIAGMLEIRRDRIGLFGPSQGSWIALAAARLAPEIAFLILQSGDATTPLEQEMYRVPALLRAERERGVVRSRDLTDENLESLTAFRRLKFQYASTGKKPKDWDRALAEARKTAWLAITGEGLPKRDFWKPNGLFDPLPILRSYNKPILAVFGGRDLNKDVALNARMMREAFAQSGNASASVVVFDDANHGLFETTSNMPLELELSRLSRLAPGYLRALADFLAARGR